MYAVVMAGGHQYRVAEGETLDVDKIPGEPGTKVSLDKVLMVGGEKTVVGSPTVKGAVVEAKITEQCRAPKVVVFKYKRRKNYKRTRGHRQPYTTIEIGKIKV